MKATNELDVVFNEEAFEIQLNVITGSPASAKSTITIPLERKDAMALRARLLAAVCQSDFELEFANEELLAQIEEEERMERMEQRGSPGNFVEEIPF